MRGKQWGHSRKGKSDLCEQHIFIFEKPSLLLPTPEHCHLSTPLPTTKSQPAESLLMNSRGKIKYYDGVYLSIPNDIGDHTLPRGSLPQWGSVPVRCSDRHSDTWLGFWVLGFGQGDGQVINTLKICKKLCVYAHVYLQLSSDLQKMKLQESLLKLF